ncbi:MAG: hypothetical protein K2H13_08440 [Eubacterium sp.]|nr:hypothetical protein [Eubacterium sp.]
MLFVILIILLITFFGIDESFDFGIQYTLALAGIIITGLAHIITLTKAVSSDAKRKNLGAKIIWTILTFLFGFPAGVFYALFTFKAGKYEERKDNRKNIILVIISIVLMFAFAIGTTSFMRIRTNYEYTHFPKFMTTYKNSDGEDVIYDKTGIAYTREEYESFKYYNRDGKTYTPVFDYDIFSNVPEIYGVKCTESNEEITEFDMYDFFIDRDGYLVIAPDNEFEYSSLGVAYNSEQNICYYISTVDWTPDGEMIFANGEDLSKITYQDIVEQKEKDRQSQRDDDIKYSFFNLFKKGDWEYLQYHCTDDFWDEYFDGSSVSGLESAELIDITEQGTAYNDESKYYIIANAKCKSSNKSSQYKILKLKVVFDYDKDYSEWKASEITVLQ